MSQTQADQSNEISEFPEWKYKVVNSAGEDVYVTLTKPSCAPQVGSMLLDERLAMIRAYQKVICEQSIKMQIAQAIKKSEIKMKDAHIASLENCLKEVKGGDTKCVEVSSDNVLEKPTIWSRLGKYWRYQGDWVEGNCAAISRLAVCFVLGHFMVKTFYLHNTA